MKYFIPKDTDLSRLYYELSVLGAPCQGRKRKWALSLSCNEELIALACEWLRHDPRLLTILIHYFKDHYKKINPYQFRQYLLHNPTPQTVGVLAEFLKKISKDKESIYFMNYIMSGLKPRKDELFFINLHPTGSAYLIDTVLASLKEYRRWGFLGLERPIIDFESRKTAGTYNISHRKNIIDELVKTKKSIQLSDYLKSIDYVISRQQAFYDLHHYSKIKLVGHGRGAHWILK